MLVQGLTKQALDLSLQGVLILTCGKGHFLLPCSHACQKARAG